MTGRNDHSGPATGQRFSVDAIQRQLNNAWRGVGAEAEAAGEPAPLRTSVLTLVVVARDPVDVARATRTLERLVRVLPSRVIQISITGPGSNLSGSATAYCSHVGERQSCYELISIEAGENDLPALPSILAQLDVSDLTTFVWWVGEEDIDSVPFYRISGPAERTIIDSARYSDVRSAFTAYLQFVEETNGAPACSDLTWSRLLVLRELVAQSFDSPATLPMLDGLRRIELTHHPVALAEALLMVGWFSSRLGLEPVSASATRDSVSLTARASDGRTIPFTLSSTVQSAPGLRAIRMVGYTAQQTSRVTLRKIDNMRALVNIDVTGNPRQQRMVHCADESDDQLLGMELLQFGRDPVYEESLRHAVDDARLHLKERISS